MEKAAWWYPSLILYLMFFLTGSWLVILYPKGEILLYINQLNHPWLDTFFRLITFFGDGFVFLLLILVYLFRKLKYLIMIVFTGVWQGILVYLFKKVMFSGSLRPSKFFEQLENLYLVPGVEVHSYHSFPSGHTTTAFSVALLILLLSRNRWLSLVAMLMAILAGISRVYLVQHFFMDVYAGSLLGVFTAFSGYWFIGWVNAKPHSRLDSPLIRLPFSSGQ